MILLSIFSVLGCLLVSWMMAKFNKNDNLFWILLISFLAGMAGGAIVNQCSDSANDETKTNFTQVYIPTQVSPATSVDFCTELGDTHATMAEPAGKAAEIPVLGSKVSFLALSKTFGEIRGQPPTKHPMMCVINTPFDTS